MDRATGDKDVLNQELGASREHVVRLEKDIQEALHDLGRHLANLKIDGGFAEIGDLIEKARNLRGSLKETDEEILHARRLVEDYRTFKRDLANTRREAKALLARVERQIGWLGEQAYEAFQRLDDADKYREYFAELLDEEAGAAGGEADADSEHRDTFVGRLKLLRKVLDLRGAGRRQADHRKNRFPRLGWRLLKTDFDQRVDGELRDLFQTVRKNLMNLMELERHQKHREEGLSGFDREMKAEWGYPDVESMRRDLVKQRAEMQDGVDSMYSSIGDLFNKHRLHNYVDDSFVAACRKRIKRFHVRINQLKLRQKEILLKIKNDRLAADQAPDGNEA